MEKKVTSTTAKGLLISLVLIVLSTVARIANLDTESWFRWLSMFLLGVGIVSSCVIYSNQSNHDITFGNIFSHGFKTAAVVTCITILFSILLFLIMPELKQRFFEIAAKQAEQSGATEEMVQKQQGFLKQLFWALIIGGIMLTYLFVGVVASLIGAAVARKNPHTPFGEPVNQ